MYGLMLSGVVSAFSARVSAGYACERLCQALYFGLLILVGIATVVTLGIAPGIWLTTAMTFCVMILAVVWDFKPQPNRHSYF
jgi:hypothetical protein